MTLTHSLLRLAESWAAAGGSTLRLWPLGEHAGVALLHMPPAQAGCMACALALRDALVLEPDYGKAVVDLGLEPIQQHAECPRA